MSIGRTSVRLHSVGTFSVVLRDVSEDVVDAVGLFLRGDFLPEDLLFESLIFFPDDFFDFSSLDNIFSKFIVTISSSDLSSWKLSLWRLVSILEKLDTISSGVSFGESRTSKVKTSVWYANPSTALFSCVVGVSPPLRNSDLLLDFGDKTSSSSVWRTSKVEEDVLRDEVPTHRSRLSVRPWWTRFLRSCMNLENRFGRNSQCGDFKGVDLFNIKEDLFSEVIPFPKSGVELGERSFNEIKDFVNKRYLQTGHLS